MFQRLRRGGQVGAYFSGRDDPERHTMKVESSAMISELTEFSLPPLHDFREQDFDYLPGWSTLGYSRVGCA